MRIWVDITDAADVVFFAPIVRRLESGGHIVTVTARRFASADAILKRYGVGAVLVASHEGGSLAARAVGLANRTRQLLASASVGRFDVATGTHTSDFVLAGWTLGIPQLTFMEEDGLRGGRASGMRFADEVAVPDAIATEALLAFRPAPKRFVRYPGFAEEYYLHDVHPEPNALPKLGIDDRRVVGIVRPARADSSSMLAGVAKTSEAALTNLTREIAGRRNTTLVVLARDREQRQRLVALGLPNVVVPGGFADGVGLLAAADFVLGDDTAMAREAAALGTPAYTVSRLLTAVDRALVSAGRLTIASRVEDIVLKKKATRTPALEPRDPYVFVDEILALARRRARRALVGTSGDARRETR